jgi:hypothetical protein
MIVFLFAISGCVSLPETFTTKNVMKIHQGMNSDEIIKMFGHPKNIDISVCGKFPNQWNCTSWEYGDRVYDNAKFVFQNDEGKLVLNSFRVDRD